MHTCRILLVVALVGAGVEAPAQLIAHDSFTGYTAGELNGQWQGYGWTTAWSVSTTGNTSVVTGSDLTYGGLTGATGLAQVNNYAGMGNYRSFAAVDSGTLYFGALVKYSDTGSGIRLIGFNGDNTTNNAGSVLLGQYNGSNGSAAETTYQYLTLRPYTGYNAATQIGVNTGISVTTQTVYLVGKIEFNTSGASDSVWFWVNPASASDLQNNANFDAASINPFDLGNVGGFSAYVNDNSGFYFDEVRISRSSSDMFGAIPEPSAYAVFAGLVALGFVAYRNRHKVSI